MRSEKSRPRSSNCSLRWNDDREAMTIPIYDDVAEAQRTVLRRQLFDDVQVSELVEAGLHRVFGAGTSPTAAVDRIIADVRAEGDAALHHYSRELEGVDLDHFVVDDAALDAALKGLVPEVRGALELAAERIERFHARQSRQSWVDW